MTFGAKKNLQKTETKVFRDHVIQTSEKSLMSFPAEQLAALLQRTQQIAEIQKNQELQKESQNDENLSRKLEHRYGCP